MTELPNWDLTDLYNGIDDPQIDKDIERLTEEVKVFKETYHSRLADLSAEEFFKSLKEREKITDLFYKLHGYGFLSRSVKETDEQVSVLSAKISDKLSPLTEELFFYDLEICHLSDAKVNEFLLDSFVSPYSYYIHEIRKMKPHMLSEEMEKLAFKKSQTGSNAFVRLYDEQVAAMLFDYNGQQLNDTQVTNLLLDGDASVRQQAGKALVQGYQKQMLLFTRIYNTLLKDKQNDDEIFSFPTALSARNLANDVSDEEVSALVDTVLQNAPICQSYYRLKTKALGLKEFSYWDRNAPILNEDTKDYSWEEAKEIVVNAYENFSPRMGEIARLFFKEGWIDAAVYNGKRSGAFASSGPASMHPYLLVNFMGKADDVMTLAHEMGHGIHQYLARRQGNLMKDPGLNLAETASIFGEMLTFKSLMRQTQSKTERFLLLSNKISDMINTAFRQVAFHRFEVEVHRHRREKGELCAQDLQNYFVQTQHEILGSDVTMKKEDGAVFAGIPHFVHTPFYVYSYSFAACLVNSLYRLYEEGNVPHFEDKYIELLSAGGSREHNELLAPFGLNTLKPDFWQKGLDVVKEMMQELDTLYGELVKEGVFKENAEENAKEDSVTLKNAPEIVNTLQELSPNKLKNLKKENEILFRSLIALNQVGEVFKQLSPEQQLSLFSAVKNEIKPEIKKQIQKEFKILQRG